MQNRLSTLLMPGIILGSSGIRPTPMKSICWVMLIMVNLLASASSILNLSILRISFQLSYVPKFKRMRSCLMKHSCSMQINPIILVRLLVRESKSRLEPTEKEFQSLNNSYMKDSFQMDHHTVTDASKQEVLN